MIERYYCGNGDGMFNDKKGSYILYSDHMKAIKKLKHGGKRKGSGRKKGEPTTTKRVPVSLIPKIDELIKLSEIKKINES